MYVCIYKYKMAHKVEVTESDFTFELANPFPRPSLTK